MRILYTIALLLALAACRTEGLNTDRDRGNEQSVMGPDSNVYYPDEGTYFEFGGSISIDGHSVHKKNRAQ
ncbi:MAG: hypothetical protein R6X27_04660 [Candidatus Desulfacyla sp.]